jgi:protein TonB
MAAPSRPPELQFLLPEQRTDFKRFFGGAGLTYLVAGLITALVILLRPPIPGFTPVEEEPYDLTDIVFLPTPGPGGGGGGGGNKSPEPPKTTPTPPIKTIEPPPPTPVPVQKPPDVEETPPAAEIPAIATNLDLAVVAPGPPVESSPSLGTGSGTGAGTGTGSGVGPGRGSGLGPGEGGGTGGGIYQPGSGALPPVALNNPKPMYTPEAMLRRIQGDVTLACIVLKTGDMGDCNVTKSLDGNQFGLDSEAIKAARKYKFKPATFKGEPVAMQVNIILTFTMR